MSASKSIQHIKNREKSEQLNTDILNELHSQDSSFEIKLWTNSAVKSYNI